MLRARIYINFDELDDIQIVNARIQNTREETKYQVDTLNSSFTVYHSKADGWIKLLIKVLKGIEDRRLDWLLCPKDPLILMHDKTLKQLKKDL